MSQELLYTSAPHGLKPGSRGFCTVLSTQGMAAPLASALEGLSGYRPAFPPGDEQTDLNPINWSHVTLPVAGRTWHILSRIAEYGLDYSQRTNKLAHHVVLDSAELITAGPAALLANSGFMRDEWNEEPHLAPPKPVHKIPPLPRGVCQAWKELTGDAGWAGVLAESFMRDPERPVILLYAPGQDMLPLIAEALSLIPADRRWEVTFSTYFTGLPQSVNCNWRCMLSGSPEAHQSLRFVRALRLDLTNPDGLGIPAGNELVADARGMPRLKTGLQGKLPPLPFDVKDVADNARKASANSAGEGTDDAPPLPGSNVYQTRRANNPPIPRPIGNPAATSTVADEIVRPKNKTIVIGGVCVALLLLVGFGICVAISLAKPPPPPVRGEVSAPTLSSMADNLANPQHEKRDSKGRGETDVVGQRPSKPKRATGPSSTVDVSRATTPGGAIKVDATPTKMPDPPPITINTPAIPEANKNSAGPTRTAIQGAGVNFSEDSKDNEVVLLSQTADSNPFSSVVLATPANLHLKVKVAKPVDDLFQLNIIEGNGLVDSKLARLSTNVRPGGPRGQPFEYKLILKSIGNAQKVARMNWCEIQNSDSTEPALFKFHPFPLRDNALKTSFAFNQDGTLRAVWDLKVAASDDSVPTLELPDLLMKIGGTDYRFAATSGKAREPLTGFVALAELQSESLNKRLEQLFPLANRVVVAEAITIQPEVAIRKTSSSARPTTIVDFRFGGFAKLEKLLSEDCQQQNGKFKRHQGAIKKLADTLKISFEAKKAPDPAKIESFSELVVSQLKQLRDAPPDGEQRTPKASPQEVQAAIEQYERLKKTSHELVEFKTSLEQCEFKSANLFYRLQTEGNSTREIYIFQRERK